MSSHQSDHLFKLAELIFGFGPRKDPPHGSPQPILPHIAGMFFWSHSFGTHTRMACLPLMPVSHLLTRACFVCPQVRLGHLSDGLAGTSRRQLARNSSFKGAPPPLPSGLPPSYVCSARVNFFCALLRATSVRTERARPRPVFGSRARSSVEVATPS